VSTYDCCVKNHPTNALDACGHPPQVLQRSTSTARGQTPPRQEPVTTPGPVEPSYPSPRLPQSPPRPGPDVMPIPQREPEEAARKRSGSTSKPVPKPPEVFTFPDAWDPVPGQPPWRPCIHKGTGGPGPSNPRAVADWIRCTYQCGMYQVSFYVFGKKSEDCKRQNNLDRAEGLAKNSHAQGKGR
jgi:hypothetical protein